MEKLIPKKKDAQAEELKTGLGGEASHLPCLELELPKPVQAEDAEPSAAIMSPEGRQGLGWKAVAYIASVATGALHV